MGVIDHVVCRVGAADNFGLDVDPADVRFVLPIDVPGASPQLTTNVWEKVDRLRLSPTQEAIDFFRLAASVYAADIRIPRSRAFDRWTRAIALHLPVSDIRRWRAVEEPMTALLQFLTGDHWRLHFREQATPRPPHHLRLRRKARPLETDTACLSSGGLDSFVGAVDALSRGQNLFLVSHYGGGGSRHASPAQDEVVRILGSEYGGDRMRHFKVNVDPDKALTRVFEKTTRGRSVIFLALGVLAASSLGTEARLLIPENGLISLNVPLTFSRLGSMSTRTTHPYILHLLGRILTSLGITVTLENPYALKTKGQMLTEAAVPHVLQRGLGRTMSCAHPGLERHQGVAGTPRHCGYCVPCIIRRAAELASGFEGLTQYNYYVEKDALSPTKEADLRAFEIAVCRARGRDVVSVLQSGPLPGQGSRLREYAELYRRGLVEVAAFIGK